MKRRLPCQSSVAERRTLGDMMRARQKSLKAISLSDVSTSSANALRLRAALSTRQYRASWVVDSTEATATAEFAYHP